MNVIWLTPIGWLGLTLLVIPVVIHLLTDRQTRHIPFPTLRFLRQTRLAALRRRALHNWSLLVLRLAILAAAAAALAAPVLVSESRQQEWQRRVARAVVIVPGTTAREIPSLVQSEQRDSFVSWIFTPERRVADGLRDAALWLRRQPPAAQEVVVLGDLRHDALGPADLSLVPPRAGLRLLPVPSGGGGTDADFRFREANVLWRAHAALNDAGTRVSYTGEHAAESPLAVRAAPGDRAAANAALNAVLARGIDVQRDAERRVLVVFSGGGTQDLTLTTPPTKPWMRESLAALWDLSGGAHGDTLVVQSDGRASAPEAARVLERVTRVVFGQDRAASEPLRMSPQRLAAWSRPPADVERPALQDEGDRRWLWGVVLILMTIETFARRTRPRAIDATEIDARVA